MLATFKMSSFTIGRSLRPASCLVRAFHHHQQQQQQQQSSGGGGGGGDGDRRRWVSAAAVGAGAALAAAAAIYVQSGRARVSAAAAAEGQYGKRRADLPTYTMEQVAEHADPQNRVWLTYDQGVYDVTEFIKQHPGGMSIMMGAGGSADPFWDLYSIHKEEHVLKLLERYRIGNVSEQEVGAHQTGMGDSWAAEPRRHPALRPSSKRPFNAEPPPPLLADSYITPTDLFYVRNHLPVPTVEADDYELEIDGIGVRPTTLTLQQLRTRFPPATVTAAVMCAGNRRSEMSAVKPVRGLNWGHAAVGNARWTGARLADVLRDAGYDERSAQGKHVCFEGLDLDPASEPYGASIPLERALDPRRDVLLAYEMNGAPLSRDHGFPVRVLVPGVVGARNVKWLGRIVISDEESGSHWQQNDYKGFNSSVDWDTVDFSKSPAIQELPVNSAICWPADGKTVKVAADNTVAVKGYAWSGGGQRVVRVDLSADGGRSWHTATLDAQDEAAPAGRCWAWTLWSARLPVPPGAHSAQIWVKATDASYNTQPESTAAVWNLRGVLSNAYHKVNVHLRSAQ